MLVPLILPAVARAAQADYFVRLNTSALQPGQNAALAVVVDIQPGLHIQSHEPLDEASKPNAFTVQMKPDARIEFLQPIYPEPKIEDFPALGRLSVYTGRVIVYVPIRVKADAAAGEVVLQGTVSWQACSDKVCFAPQKDQPFSLTSQIVPAGQAVSATGGELFAGFDARVFSQGSPAAPPTPPPTRIDFFGWHFDLASSHALEALLLALAVGVIFNLVPCVLPVVPLKAIGFFEVSRHNRARCMLLGAVFSLGVVSVFVVLAWLLVPLRQLTHYSWGEQFQYAWFVWPLVAILVAMALGMMGLFEIVLPSGIYNLAPRHDTIAGNYLFGMLTAVLSTPCTAPMFVGLEAWAVAQPVPPGVAVVVTVGIGMALPYLILSAFPALARHVPRTGPWSAILKQIMGFLVLAVAVYFAAGRLTSREHMFWAVFAVIAAAMIFLVVRSVQLTRRLRPILTSAVVAAAVVLLSLWVVGSLVGQLQWERFSPAALQLARGTGRPVLVEFTANWCGNCQWLEGHVYTNPQTAKAIHDHQVILLRADLTSDNPQGWDAVNRLNPGGGIPLTAIYAPPKNQQDQQDQPITLSSLYSVRNLIDALDQASR